MKTKGTIKKLGRAVKKHKARILTAAGIGLGVTAAVVAVKATPDELMDEEDMKLLAEQEGRVLTKMDFVKVKFKHYWPALATGAAAIGCVVTSDFFDIKDIKTMAKGWMTAQEALKTYKETAREQLGEKKSRQLKDKAAENTIKKDPLSPYNTEFDVNSNGFLCYDANSGRYFKSTWEILNAAVNSINDKIHQETYAVLNDFYDLVGLKAVDIGVDNGWDIDICLEPTCHMGEGVDDPDCVVINFDHDPGLNYLCRGL